ncbi:hypothetical protein AB4144_21115 [Rhizobiaceae sp. 2RAB30]
MSQAYQESPEGRVILDDQHNPITGMNRVAIVDEFVLWGDFGRK